MAVKFGYLEEESLVNIANAIRNKTSKTESLSIDSMPSEILSIETGVDTTDANASATDLLLDKTAYVNGVKITGTITSKEGETYIPTDTQQTISQGQYLSGDQIIAAVTADNLPESLLEYKEVEAPLTNTLTITPSEGKVIAAVRIAASGNRYTGSVDEEGLRSIGWNDEDIQYLKDNICWMAEDDPFYMVSDADKFVYDNNNWLNVDEIDKSKLMGIKYLPRTKNENNTAISTIDLSNIPTLIAMPKLTTNEVTSISFTNDVSLICIPPLNISNVTNLDNCFSGCRSLFTVPALDYSQVVSANNCFSQCNSLSFIPNMNLPSLTSYNDMFYDDFAIKSNGVFAIGDKTEFDCSIMANSSMPYLNIDGPVTTITNADKLTFVKAISINSDTITSMTGLFNSPRLEQIYFPSGFTFANIESPLGMPTYVASDSGTYEQGSACYYIHKSFQQVSSVSALLEVMDRGVPSFDNPSMYFEPGFTVWTHNNEANRLAELICSCTSKGWHLFNLGIRVPLQ